MKYSPIEKSILCFVFCPSPDSMSVLPLGDDELAAVLRCLPTEERLTSCSLVSTQFRRAATAATTDSVTVRAASVSSSSFQRWLKQHGRAVRGLHVLPSNSPYFHVLPADLLQQLPNLSSLLLPYYGLGCGQFWQELPDMRSLTQLSVTMHCSIPGNILNSALPRLQQLKKLSLTAPHVVISSSEAPVFSQLTALQQLSLSSAALEPLVLQPFTQLEDLSLSVGRYTGTQGQSPALFALLEQLPLLTQLQLSGACDPPFGSDTESCAALADRITAGSRLQHLKLHVGLPEAAWKVLFPADCQLSNLRSVDIAGRPHGARCLCSPATFPWLSGLTALQSLQLQGFVLDTDSLRRLTVLTSLQLQDVQLQSAAHAAAIFDVLPKLKQLRLLAVDSGSVTGEWGAVPLLHAFPSSQVVTNRQLQHFRLGWVRLRGDFWKQLFASQELLPYLQDQHTTHPAAGTCLSAVPAAANWMLVDAATFQGMATKVGYVSTEDLDGLVQSFPRLSTCAISLDPAGVQLDALQNLTDLRELSVSHAAADTPRALAAAFRHTTALRVLQLWFHGRDCGEECSNVHQLQALTALTQLTRLVCGCYCEAACSSSSSPEGADPGTLFEGRGPVSHAVVLK